MKLFTTEEANAYYSSVWRWGTLTGLIGLSGGVLVVGALNRFYRPFRSLSMTIKSSLALYPGIISTAAGANHAAHLFDLGRRPEKEYKDAAERAYEQLRRRESALQRAKEWGYEHRYKLSAGTWAAAMVATLAILRRDPLMTGTQKLVQARVAAQASTVGIVLLTTAMELRDVRQGRGKYEEVVVVDPSDPRHEHLQRVRYESARTETQ